MKQNSRKSPTHLAVRRHGLPPIFALVGFTEPPLAAVGWAGESILRTGGSGEPSRKSGRYDIEGRRRYSANRPLDCLPAPPGVGERYELPKGSSWSLHLLAGASSGGPPHRHQSQGARCQFCITIRLLSEPSLSSKTRLRSASTPLGALCYTSAILPPYAGGGAPDRRGYRRHLNTLLRTELI